jgi:hypothetical protein
MPQSFTSTGIFPIEDPVADEIVTIDGDTGKFVKSSGTKVSDLEPALGFTPEDVANKQTDLTASATKYPTVDAVNTGLATKQNSLGFTPANSATTLKIGGTEQSLASNRTWLWSANKYHIEAGETVTLPSKYSITFHTGIINEGTIINNGILNSRI